MPMFRKSLTIFGAIAIATTASASDFGNASQALPTGQLLTPLAAPGAKFEPLVTHTVPHPSYVADGAAAIAVSPNGREMLVLTSGFNLYNGADGKRIPAQSTQYVFRYAIDGAGSRLLQTLTVPNSYSGIAWQPNGRGFIVGGGVDDNVHLFQRRGRQFVETGAPIALGHTSGNGADVKPQAAGVAISPDGRRALVANYYNDSVSMVDLSSGTVIAEQDLRPGKIDPAMTGVAGGENPFAIAWIDASHAWVSAPRDRQLVALELASRSISVRARIATLGAPTALLFDKSFKRLYAAEDNADRLAIVETVGGRLVGEPRLGMPESLGYEPVAKGLNVNALALLPDHRLLVTMGGINALALVEPSASGAVVEGLIPTGWYPSAVAINVSGTRVFVANRKSPPGPNPQGCAPALAIYRGQPEACGASNQYIFQLEKAGLLNFPLPSPRAMVRTTRQVADNIGLGDKARRAAADATMAAVRARIKHVVLS